MAISDAIGLSDEYSRNARLKPALLVGLPVAFLAATYGLKFTVLLGAMYGPLAAAGVTFLLAQLSRDFGVWRQARLFKNWGGKPSVLKLRHCDPSLNRIMRARYHARAAELLGRPMPSAAEESADPEAADSIYDAFCALLLERTRDTKVFRLLFQELMNYGFRRNLLGMKPIGLSLCLACLAVQAVSVVHAFRLTGHVEILGALFLGVEAFLLLCWVSVIRPDWVRRAADAYAERLLSASEQLSASGSRGGAERTAAASKGSGGPRKREVRLIEG